MSDLRTSYMGIQLPNPIIVGSSPLTSRVENIKALEAGGAAAVVLKSLFEDQVRVDADRFERDLESTNEISAEATTLFPHIEHGGIRTYLHWVNEVRKAVKLPLVASVNCVTKVEWPEYAKALEGTGVNGIELNFYTATRDMDASAAQIEDREVEILSDVRKAVKIPLGVKLHPFYTNLNHVVRRFEEAGADGFVLFNRLFQPDIDVDTEVKKSRMYETDSKDALLPLRWIALLSPRIRAGLAASTGISSGKDVAKVMLAGARAVEIVGAVMREKPAAIQRILAELSAWMDAHKYKNLEEFRGKLARNNPGDSWSFEFAQYVEGVVGIG